MPVQVIAVDRPDVPACSMPERFRHEITFFASDHATDGGGLPEGEWSIDLLEAETILGDGVVRLVSPLDSESRAEIELSEEQEAWLEWVVKHRVERVRLQ
ncbi:MAG: hypothetical protein M3552_03905 [Planctomycetota bacterium]|nr:hypothetical protein [Planctomycetaceae bacterium]MDQ3329785.1 hypothetical protein [Planctomycetota bacterium]